MCYAGGIAECNFVYYNTPIASKIYFQDEGYGIIRPNDLNTDRQAYTVDEIKDNFKYIPEPFKKYVRNIIIVDFDNQNEELLKSNDINGTMTVAIEQKGNIVFFANDEYYRKKILIEQTRFLDVYHLYPDIHQVLKKLLIHESFHAYDEIFKVSDNEEWKKICDNDKTILSPQNKLLYYEEFAESVSRYFVESNNEIDYIEDKKWLKENLPNRYNYIDKLFNTECQN